MRLNENTKIKGEKVILVPYEAKHVDKYHNWMQSEELQLLTASECLTLEQEYEMQKNWRNDEDKCTFLILSRELYESSKCDEIFSLIGDTNIFLRNDEGCIIAEAEIMIAEKSARGKGYGFEAIMLLLKYAQVNLGVHKFEAKIGYENSKSQCLFKKMNFQEQSRSDIFREITFIREVTADWISWVDSQVTLVCEKYY